MKMTGVYTAAGAQLAARAQAEGLSLLITRAAAGSQSTDAAAAAMAKEAQALTINSKHAQEGRCTVAAVLNAADAAAQYSLCEVGLFAKLEGESEVLYKIFRLNESLTVEPDTDLIMTFYLAETILQADQVEVTITQQGLVTQAICDQTAQAAAQTVRDELTAHTGSSSAHSSLFAQKAPLSHTHAASQITAGTLAGVVTAQTNTAYTTAQVRNIVLSTAEPSGGSNGEVWIKYTA